MDFLLSKSRGLLIDLIWKYKKYDALLWRHQTACQWRHPKNFRKVSLPNGSKNIHSNHYSDFLMDKDRVHLHSFSQDSIRRSGNWHKVNYFHKLSFEKLWLEFFIFTFLSLNIEFLRGYFLFWCLSVDESRDTVKNIFSSLTVIMWKGKIRDKLSKLYLKWKHFLHWFQKYLFCDQEIFEPEVPIKFQK